MVFLYWFCPGLAGYVYDVNPNGAGTDYPLGRLSQTRTPATGTIVSDTKYIYDSVGRVTASTQDIGGVPYPFSYIYNDLDLDTETYPSGRKIESCYDSAGRVSQLLNVTQTPATVYAGPITYSLAGGTSQTTKTLGNALIETMNTNTLLQTTSIQLGTQSAPGSALSLAYGYAAAGSNNGNVMSQTITRGAASGGQTFVQTYGYTDVGHTDMLNRLTLASEASSSGNTGWSRTLGYDPFANGWVSARVQAAEPGSIGRPEAAVVSSVWFHLTEFSSPCRCGQQVRAVWSSRSELAAHRSTNGSVFTPAVAEPHRGDFERVSGIRPRGVLPSPAKRNAPNRNNDWHQTR